MLTEPTMEKLTSLRLGAMAEAWLAQCKDTEMATLGFDDRFGLIVDAEWLARRNKRLANLMREAKVRITGACLEDIDCTGSRGLDKRFVRDLATCRWVQEHHNLVISGKTGVGKTYLCCAAVNQACRNGYRALYRRAPIGGGQELIHLGRLR